MSAARTNSNKSARPDSWNSIMSLDSSGHEETDAGAGELVELVLPRGLVSIMHRKKFNTESTANDWIGQHGSSAPAAAKGFCQFILEACGSKYQIPPHMDHPIVHSSLLEKAIDQYDESTRSYPLLMKTYTNFSSNMVDFLCSIFRSMNKAAFMADGVFINHATDFLIVCTNSKVRAFRHTGTLFAVKLMSTFHEITAVGRDERQRIWNKMFKDVFEERMRDVFHEIREICIEECGIWLNHNYAYGFFNPEKVLHIFTAMSDPAAKVREHALKALLLHFQLGSPTAECLCFAKQHVNVLLDLTVDQQSELGALAIKLITKAFTTPPNELTDDMVKVVERLVFAADHELAQATADLVNLQRFQREFPSLHPRVDVMRRMIKFYMEINEYEHANYFVDAFYSRCTVIMDWETMARFLVEPDLSSTLIPAESSAIIDIMTCCIKQAVCRDIPAGRYTRGLDIRLDCSRLLQRQATHCLALFMVPMVQRFRKSNNVHDLINLLTLPLYFDIQLYASESSGTLLQELIYACVDIIFEHSSKTVLKTAVKTLEYIFARFESQSRSHLFANALSNYELASDALNAAAAGTNSTELTNGLIKSLKVVTALFAYFDLNPLLTSQSIFESLQQAMEHECGSLSLYLEACYYSLSWHLQHVLTIGELPGHSQAVNDSCAGLRDNLERYLFVAIGLVHHREAVAPQTLPLTLQAFSSVCDVYVLFSDDLRLSSVEAIRKLECKSTVTEYELLESFLVPYIFDGVAVSASEKQQQLRQHSEQHKKSFVELQQKRIILSSYCKLVVYNVMPMMHACSVFRYYHEYYEPFGDILRSTMERAVKINANNYGMTIIHTCILAYRRIRAQFSSIGETAKSVPFAELLLLAKRLAETFQPHVLEARAGVMTVHRAGILFAIELQPSHVSGPPLNLLFLRIIAEFSGLLLEQDKPSVLEQLSSVDEASLPSSAYDDWEPLQIYRQSLKYRGRRRTSLMRL